MSKATIDIINSAADTVMSPDERAAFDKFSNDTKQRLLNQILKRAAPQGKEPVAWMYEFNGTRVFHHAQLDHLEWDSSKQDYAKGVPVFLVLSNADVEAKLRRLMEAINAYEKATGLGGWYAENVQEASNGLLKALGSEVRFGLGAENPVSSMTAFDAAMLGGDWPKNKE